MPWQRKKPLKSKSGLTRRYTKAAAKRRKRGEWSTKTCDDRFSLYIRQRDGRCLNCGATEGLDCSHYHRRGHSATRFDPNNCIALCRSCHTKWEGPKNEYTQFMLKWLGEKEFIALSLRAGLTVSRSDEVKKCKAFLEQQSLSTGTICIK